MQKPVLIKIEPSEDVKNLKEFSFHEGIKEKIKSVWENNPELLTFIECKNCTISKTKYSCDLRLSKNIENLSLKTSFTRLLNSLRINVNPTSVSEAYLDFYKVYCQRFFRYSESPKIYCVLKKLLDVEIERRGKEYNWLYEEIEEILRISYSIMAQLVSDTPIEETYYQELDSLSKLFYERHETIITPYVGCGYCNSKCQYRYDMQNPILEAQRDEFYFLVNNNMKKNYESTGAIEESEEIIINYYKRIFSVCSEAASQFFLMKSMNSLKDAALCFGFQEIEKMNVSDNAKRNICYELCCVSNMKNNGESNEKREKY